MSYDRVPNILSPFADDVFFFAPIPIVHHEVPFNECESWNLELISVARSTMEKSILDVPDVRHVADLGKPINFTDATWREDQRPAIGVWHQVPTNAFLTLRAPSVEKLTSLVESRFLNALTLLRVPHKNKAAITESWIQFYQNGDYKVLHNHERYQGPYDSNRWAGAYYIDAGDPDPTMPYAGVLSFRVREHNYLIRPRAGLLLIWPADVLHEVHPYYGKRDRVVVNFNIQPT